LVHELESYHEPLLLVSHQAVLRLMYAYLMGKPRATAPKIEIPLHTVIRITYDGWNPPHEERFVLGPAAVGYKTDGTIAKDAQNNLCDGKDVCT
jgi:broad specificity phosphatase PhoE